MSQKRFDYNKISTLETVDKQDENIAGMVEEEPMVGESTNICCTGVADGCSKLNVRVAPNIEAEVVCVIDKGTIIEVDNSESTDDWFKIYLENGVEGFCMRKFINLI